MDGSEIKMIQSFHGMRGDVIAKSMSTLFAGTSKDSKEENNAPYSDGWSQGHDEAAYSEKGFRSAVAQVRFLPVEANVEYKQQINLDNELE